MTNALLKYHVWHAHFSKYSEYIQRSLQLPEDPSAKIEYTLSCRQRKLDSQTTRLGYLIQFGREVSRLALSIPPVSPGLRAERTEGVVELTTWAEVFALGIDTLVVVNVVLPAVLGLVLLRETGIIASSHELEGLGL